MSDERDDGGSAFPVVTSDVEWPDRDSDRTEPVVTTYSEGGMSLRDWFAGQAMKGLLSNDGVMTQILEKGPEPYPFIVADRAYDMAEAMLEARKR